MVKSAVLAGLAATMLVSAAPAAASTRYVDENRTECPQAAFTTIQGAIDASASGDVIRVCAGLYREQVVVPASRARLRISGQSGAVLEAPPGGLAPVAQPAFGFGSSLAILTVLGERTVVSQMSIDGAVVATDQPAACDAAERGELRPGGVVLAARRARLESSTIGQTALDCTSPLGPPNLQGAGVIVFPPAGIQVDGNTLAMFLRGAPVGMELLGANATVQRNLLQDIRGPGVRLTEGGHSTIRSNDIFDTAAGVLVVRSLVRAIGNRLAADGTGLSLGDGARGEIRNNVVINGGDGIVVGPIAANGTRTSLLIRANEIRDNSGRGIVVAAGPRSGGNVLLGNSSLGNGELDCLDETTGGLSAGTADLWLNNVGVLDQPDVCRSP
jgi:hypothetical protein